jgi:hypothetical protein
MFSINSVPSMLKAQQRTKAVASCWLSKDDEERGPIGGMVVPEENECTSRFYRVLMRVYNTENYWVFGLCPSSEF